MDKFSEHCRELYSERQKFMVSNLVSLFLAITGTFFYVPTIQKHKVHSYVFCFLPMVCKDTLFCTGDGPCGETELVHGSSMDLSKKDLAKKA